MNTLFCTSEAFPLMKTGGLGDVCGSLPAAIHQNGHDVRVILPAYPEAIERAGDLQIVAKLKIAGIRKQVVILEGKFPGTDLVLYLVDAPDYFCRPGNPYVREDGEDWPDNAERFALFARSIVMIALGNAGIDWKPEVVHCNDWQTGLVPALLSIEKQRPRTVFTIHNLAYQGLFPAETFKALKLPESLWSINGIEFHYMMSFMKGGIANADWVTTVSPTYAKEICTENFGYGLEGLLQYRSEALTGITNGVDEHIWNAEIDQNLYKNYDEHSLQYKAFNKFALQRELNLPMGSPNFLIGHIGRLVDQKGADLILDILDDLFKHPIQLVVLGSGDHNLEQQLLEAAKKYPGQLSVQIGYNEALAHRITAACDSFVMPSRYEPCGLSQMYSLLYGTVPIVHKTGGLTDTVVNLDDSSANDGTATGFSFDQETPEALLDACLRAFDYFCPPQVNWWKLVLSGMKQDFSWGKSAREYLDIYEHIVGPRHLLADKPANPEFTSLHTFSISPTPAGPDTPIH